MKDRNIIDKLKNNHLREFLVILVVYTIISLYMLFGVITSSGQVAQQDWGIPLTASAAQSMLYSQFFAWKYFGFGSPNTGLPISFFMLLNAALAPLGFVGGTEIKILAVSLVALGGINAFILSRSLQLKIFPSFIVGLFYMTTPVLFNFLMFGWIYYMFSYDFLPLSIIALKKYIDNGAILYALTGAIMFLVEAGSLSFVIIYPPILLLFSFLYSSNDAKLLLRGFFYMIISSAVLLLNFLTYIPMHNISNFYSSRISSGYVEVLRAQFSHLSVFVNLIRLWGSTFNYQFETYFPNQLIIFSFIPIIFAVVALLFRPHNKYVIIFTTTYLFDIIAFLFQYNNFSYLIYKIPFGALFEMPVIWLIPSALSFAMLLGFSTDAIYMKLSKLKFKRNIIKGHIAFSTIVIILVVMYGAPWWMGQTSGSVFSGPPTKLNLYQMPVGYTKWNDIVNINDTYFVFYFPGKLGSKPQINGTQYFSLPYQGVSEGIYFMTNALPAVDNTSVIDPLLNNNNTPIGQYLGSLSIKYLVVYTNVIAPYNLSYLLYRLSDQEGIVKLANLQDVIVYENTYAKPIIYSNASNVSLRLLSYNPTNYVVIVNTTTPYFLIFNQAYNPEWVAYVNGSILPNNDHLHVNGMNGWYIRYKGNMVIKIYYTPQTTYFITLIVSISTLIGTPLLVVILKIFFTKNYIKKKS